MGSTLWLPHGRAYMIDVSGIEGFNLFNFLMYWLIAGIIAVGTAIAIGQERKVKWFKQRSKNGIFVRRGMFGNYSMLGVPVTVPGFIITVGIFAGAGIVWAILIYGILPFIR